MVCLVVGGVFFGRIHNGFVGGINDGCVSRIGYLGGVGSAGPFGAFTCGEGACQQRGQC